MSGAANRRSRLAGLFFTHLAALLAGATGLFGKLSEAGPASVTAWRSGVAAITLLVALLLTRTPLRMAGRRDARLTAASGIFLAAHWLTFFHAIRISTVATALLAFAAYPLIVTLAESLVFRLRLHREDIAAAAIMTCGLVFIAGPAEGNFAPALVWGVFSAALCAGYTLTARGVSARNSAPSIAFWQQVVVAAITLPLAVISGDTVGAHTAGLLILLGVVFTAGLQTLFMAGLRRITARAASLILMTEPVYACVLAALVYGEIPAPHMIAGGVLILGAAVFTTLRHAAPESPREGR